MNKEYWRSVWKKGVDLASKGVEKTDQEYEVIPTKEVELGEVSINDPEWVESVRHALLSPVPSLAFEHWRKEGWLKHALPEIDTLWGIPQPEQHHPEVDTGIHAMMVIDRAAAKNCTEASRWAALAHDFGKSITPKSILPSHHGHEQAGVPLVLERYSFWSIPKHILDTSLYVTEQHGKVHNLAIMKPTKIFQIIEEGQLDESSCKLLDFCDAIECDDQGRKNCFNVEPRGTKLLKECVENLIESRKDNFHKFEEFWKFKCEKYLEHKQEDISADLELKERLREIQYRNFDVKSISDTLSNFLARDKKEEPIEQKKEAPKVKKNRMGR